MIEIAPTGVEVDLAPFAGVIFTSANGVAHAPKGDGRPAFCVGPQTTAAAAKAGWQAQMAGLDAQTLIATLSGQPQIGPLLHLAGRHRRADVAAILGASGLTVDVATIYEQNLLPLSAAAQTLLNGPSPVIVPLFSPAARSISPARPVAQSGSSPCRSAPPPRRRLKLCRSMRMMSLRNPLAKPWRRPLKNFSAAPPCLEGHRYAG
ncbi:uroporphyrinogen-III synthase [Sulfitobacter profundi]|uniref:Uroporphyrinogen-III synthase n=1 Tax=Sulfitobacter profundi TaxID=2679961 RepID=A0ABW1YX02_9RHOB